VVKGENVQPIKANNVFKLKSNIYIFYFPKLNKIYKIKLFKEVTTPEKNMKKKEWANAVWFLFHTLAEKIKEEYCPAELSILFGHVTSICNNLPCPDCQGHAMLVVNKADKRTVTASKENFKNFLWQFHNGVNQRIKLPYFSKQQLDDKYKMAKTSAIVQNFIQIMSRTANNEKVMMHAFHRKLYIKTFIDYMNDNFYKFV